MNFDMNESEPETKLTPEPTGIPVAKLLEIIGKQQVEWLVEEEGVVKLKEQALAIFQQNQALTLEVASLKSRIATFLAEPAKPVAIPAELAKLQAVNSSKDEEIHLLEKQVHEIAVERDAAVVQTQTILLDLKNVQAQCADLQLQKIIDATPPKEDTIVKGKKKG